MSFIKLGQKIAPILCLQLDNTVKENKSRYVMAYLQALVDCGLFQEINVSRSFFQVGYVLIVTLINYSAEFQFINIFVYKLFNFFFVFHTCFRRCEYILAASTCNIFLLAAQFNFPECTEKTLNFHLWNSKFLDSPVVSNSHLTISHVLHSFVLFKSMYYIL